MDEREPSVGEVRHLKYLKWLVTILTVTMIGGVLTVVVLLVMQFGAIRDIPLPTEVVLPDGASAVAFTQGSDWYAVVTDADEILVFSRTTGVLRQRIEILAD